MDDFIFILNNKQDCIRVKKDIELFLHSNLHLELNSKSRYYPDKMGVNYCGYRTFTTHRLLRLSSKKKIKGNVKFWNHLYAYNSLDMHKTIQQLNSWLGHSKHSNSYHLQQKILNSCNFIFTNNTDLLIENNLISDLQKPPNTAD